MKAWSDEALVDLLRDAYDDADAPAPSAALLACFDSGALPGTTLPEPLAPLEPLASRRRRVRAVVLVAAASLVTFGALAGAGALPGPIQRGAASLARHVGVELPSPGGDSHRDAPGSGSVPPVTTPLPTTTGSSDAPVEPSSSSLPAGTLVPSPLLPTLPPTPTVTLPVPGLPGAGATVPTTLPELPSL
jgi:hypothetical protein